MKALVTGGNGFIGRHIIKALKEEGIHAIGFDNFSSSDLSDETECIDGDIRDFDVLFNAMQEIDFVFHQAAMVSVPESIKEPLLCNEINVNGTINVLEAAREAGVKKVILASSAAVYGDNESIPVSEKELPNPLSPYASSKIAAEYYCKNYSENYGLETVCLRYFNVFGPGQKGGAIPLFLEKALKDEKITVFGDGNQTRDFVFAEDVARANVLAMKSSISKESINVCTSKETSINDLLKLIEEITGKKLNVEYKERRSGEIIRSLGDNSKAKKLLGFEPKTGIMEGLQKTWNWMVKK